MTFCPENMKRRLSGIKGKKDRTLTIFRVRELARDSGKKTHELKGKQLKFLNADGVSEIAKQLREHTDLP